MPTDPDRPRRRPPAPTARARRLVAAVLAVALLAAGLLLVPARPAAAAGYNALSFADGSPKKTFGANGTVRIDGVLAYDDGCIYDQGVKDFFYAASDVYLVPTGSAGGKLVDAGGDNPNTVVATSSGAFLDEVIAFTSPAGNLGAGVYDVIFDTCQDGFLTSDDAVFAGVVTVELPETLPSPSGAIASIKEQARLQYVNWLQTHTILTALFNADKAKEILACILFPNPMCALAVLAHLMDEGQLGSRQANQIQELAGALAMNVAKNHGAIWKDPPDADFAQLPVLDRPADGDLPTAGQPLFDALTGLLPALADEAALTEALLHAMERYQGAQAAGDGDWALAQARAARDLSRTLAEQLAGSGAVAALRSAVAAGAATLDASTATGADFANRVRTSGFTADEQRALANLGLSPAEVVDLEAQYVASGPVVRYDAADLLAALDQVGAARTAMVPALAESAAGWDGIVAALEATPGRSVPEADAGGPYAAAAGAPVALDATGSTPGTYEWDLDADGAFDDATGATPTATLAPGDRLVGLRVTDAAGRRAVDTAVVDVTGGDRPPAVTASSPAAAASVTVGSPLQLSVTAGDPDGAALSFRWKVDGAAPAPGGPTFAWTPTAADIGNHTVTVTVSDGTSAGTLRTWRVRVLEADADGDGWTATSDCDDARADVSPAMFERLGNGLDDDCDASTRDAPPGGLTGDVWSWGQSAALGTGTFTDQRTPVLVPSLAGAGVTRIEAADRRGFAVLANGQVKAWGENFSGSLGDGTQTARRSPVGVVGVGGDGLLTDVRRLAAEVMHTVAVRADGSVLAWGSNANGQVGDGSTVTERLHPVEVRTADGAPLTGAVDVDAGESSSYALGADGTVHVSGVLRCAGYVGPNGVMPKTNTAQPMSRLGTGVVQVSAGKGLFLARKADGSVWSCGGDPEELDRGKENPTLVETVTPMPMAHFGPGSGVVDVSAHPTGGFAVKADGTLWGWGHNLNGVLDPITPDDHRVFTPTRVPLPPGPPVVDVDADDACHVEVLRADGSVLSWGCNSFGAAGIGTIDVQTPGVHTLALPGRSIAVSASGWNGLALVRPLDDPAVERPAFWVRASAADASVGEATGGSVQVDLSEAAPFAVDVSWALDGGASGTATIPAGATSVAVPVSVADNAVDEDDRTLAFSIVAVSDGVEVARRTATVTVVDDDAAPVVSVRPAAVVEGDTSLTDARVTVDLSSASGRDVEVRYATGDGTATGPADYTPASGSLTIPAGATSAVVHVAVAGDTAVEPHESFTVSLSDPVHASPGGMGATVTVTDDEPLRLAVASPTVTEGDAGTTPAPFTVSVTPPPAGVTVGVPWSVAAGTAETPADVAAAAGTLVLDSSAPSGAVTAAVAGDTADEADEVFRLAVGTAVASDGRPVVLADPTVATVVDDDAPAGPGYEFDGFYSPVDNLPTVNLVQAGRAVPLRFSLGGDHGTDIFEAGSPSSARIACESGAALDAVEETATPGASALTYDPATGVYQYVWQTQKAWAGQCRLLMVRFADGTEATATFRLR